MLGRKSVNLLLSKKLGKVIHISKKKRKKEKKINGYLSNPIGMRLDIIVLGLLKVFQRKLCFEEISASFFVSLKEHFGIVHTT
jgi:hypothetical protein